MLNENKIANAENILNSTKKENIKIVKRDNGLLERSTLENKVILTEDNRQVLLG